MLNALNEASRFSCLLYIGIGFKRGDTQSILLCNMMEVWQDSGAVMVRGMNTFGNPVEMDEKQTKEFSRNVHRAMLDAS